MWSHRTELHRNIREVANRAHVLMLLRLNFRRRLDDNCEFQRAELVRRDTINPLTPPLPLQPTIFLSFFFPLPSFCFISSYNFKVCASAEHIQMQPPAAGKPLAAFHLQNYLCHPPHLQCILPPLAGQRRRHSSECEIFHQGACYSIAHSITWGEQLWGASGWASNWLGGLFLLLLLFSPHSALKGTLKPEEFSLPEWMEQWMGCLEEGSEW